MYSLRGQQEDFSVTFDSCMWRLKHNILIPNSREDPKTIAIICNILSGQSPPLKNNLKEDNTDTEFII